MSDETTTAPAFRTMNAQLFHDFLAADPARAEPFRLAHCGVCRSTAESGANAGLRAITCRGYRCGLRDPEKMRAEQEWITIALHRLLDPQLASDDEIMAFNTHIAEAGCVTPALVPAQGGRRSMGFATPTLRGELHAALVGYFTGQSGGLYLDAADVSTEDAHATVVDARRAQTERQKQLAAAWRAQGMSDKQIGHRLGKDPKMIRIWLGRRTPQG
jgi:hypothetical protein